MTYFSITKFHYNKLISEVPRISLYWYSTVLTWSDKPEVPRESPGTCEKLIALTVFTQGKARHSSKPKQCKKFSLAKHPSECSRVGTIRQAVGLSPKEFAREQAKDPFCQSLKLGTHEDKGEFFPDEQGLIYRRNQDDRIQLIVPKALVNEVMSSDMGTVRSPGTSEFSC